MNENKNVTKYDNNIEASHPKFPIIFYTDRGRIMMQYTQTIKNVWGWQFLTMKAAETLCIVCLPPGKHISLKKKLGNRPSKKSLFIRVWPSNLHFYGCFKNGKMNFFQNSLSGRTPSALLIWLKTILHNRLKNWILSNKHKYAELFAPSLVLLWSSQ